jgi:hypothetical protein
MEPGAEVGRVEKFDLRKECAPSGNPPPKDTLKEKKKDFMATNTYPETFFIQHEPGRNLQRTRKRFVPTFAVRS